MLILDGMRAKLILVISCMVCYAMVARNDYSLDDDFAFYKNVYVQKGINGIPDILTHPYYSDGNLTFDYRPIASITFAIEKELFGNNPHVSHVGNLIFYILCVLLVYALMVQVFSLDIWLAFLIALFFAMHPVHTEVVASIKNREELLSFIFCFLGFFAVERFFQQSRSAGKAKYGVLTVVCLLLSFASKLTSIPMFGIILIMLYFKGWQRQKMMFYSILGIIGAISALYLFVIFSISNRPVYDLENPLVMYHDMSTKIGTTAASLLFYLKFMWVPYPFSFFYGYNTIPVAQIDDPVSVLSIFIHLGVLIYGAILFFRKKIAGFFILSYFIAISVYSNIAKPYTGIVSERALFFPSLWFIGAVCSIVYDRVAGKKAGRLVLTGFATILLAIYGVLNIDRVDQWHDSIRLMRHDVKHLANSTLANYFYGCVLKVKAEEQHDTILAKRYLAEAKTHLYQTNENSPVYPYGYFRLGLIYRYDTYQPDSAYYYFNKAYSLNSNLTDVGYQYGRTQYEFGDKIKAATVFASLYQRLPDDTFVVFYHALLQMKTGHMAEGKKIADRFMLMAPGYYQSHFNMGLYYELTGDADNAAKEYQTSVNLGCTDYIVYRFLMNYYHNHGNGADADRFRKLIG